MDIKPKLENIDLGEVLGLGAALAIAKTAGEGGRPYAALPPGWKTEDLEKYLPAPTRAKGSVQLGDAPSFVRYVNKHKDTPGAASAARRGANSDAATDADDMQTVLLVDIINSKFRAIFDSNASDAPGWGEHTASYNCPLSPQWKLWNASNGKGNAAGQEEFAFFIEQNMLDILEPNGAEMLQIITTLKAKKDVQYDSAIRLDNGQTQLKYHETVAAAAGVSGELKIPEKIALAIPVYVGQAPYRVEAFLRYRLSQGRIVFWYDLITPERILEHSLTKVREEIESGTSMKCYAVAAL